VAFSISSTSELLQWIAEPGLGGPRLKQGSHNSRADESKRYSED